MHYRVAPAERAAFLATMREVRQVRGRAGALFWQLYEDVAHPEGWLEVWSMESWTDHLREVGRLSEEDRAVLARAAAFQRDPGTRPPARYLAVDPTVAAADGEAAGRTTRPGRRCPAGHRAGLGMNAETGHAPVEECARRHHMAADRLSNIGGNPQCTRIRPRTT